MPNEFIARNGLIALNNTTITGSLNITGSITSSGDIMPFIANTGNIGTATLRFSTIWSNSLYGVNTVVTTIKDDGVSPITFANLGNSISVARLYTSTTGNLLLRSSSAATYSDNGYKLQIYSEAQNTGSLYITGSASHTLLRIDSPASSSIIYISGSGRVGMGTSNPTASLHIVDSGVSGINTLQLNNRFQFKGDGALLFGSSADRGRLTWDGSGAYFHGQSGYGVGIGANGSLNHLFITTTARVGIGTTSASSKLQVVGAGATSATTTFLLQNSTPTTLMTVLDNGQFTYTTPTMTLAASQSAYVISPIITASNTVGGNYYGINITPTFYQTTGSQTQTAFRVASTFSQSSAAATLGTNVIADFGATSVGSQLTVTDVTSGSIYMVNDVSGLPIIEATSDWTVRMYNFPQTIFEKTGSQVNINGTLRVSGSFILPLSQSVSPQTGSAYWSGSLLFVYDGTRYRSSSFA
jgi:hypothetical protein